MIPGELARLLVAQEQFDALRAALAPLGPRVVDLSYANFGGPVDRAVRTVLEESLRNDRDLAFQYTPFGGSRVARRAAAVALSRCHGQDYEWRDVVLTSGAAPALAICLDAVAGPGAQVVIPTPCWFDHPLYIAAAGKDPVLVPSPVDDDTDGFPEAVASVVGPRTRGVLLTNPSNPTGQNHSRAVLGGLAGVLATAEARYGTTITMIADECHRDLAGPEWSPMARWWDRTVTVYSFGKYHALQGQRLGYVAVSPRHGERQRLRDHLTRWVRIRGNVTPTALMQLALPGLADLDHDLEPLNEWRTRYVAALGAAGYEVVRPDGTPFLYTRTPVGISDQEWIESLARHHHLLATPASLFHHHGYFRLALTAEPDQLETGLAALMDAGDRWC